MNRIDELQQELNLVSKEINNYAEFYSDNTLFKKVSNFHAYSSKLKKIIISDLYKNSLTPKSLISSDKKGLKTQIETNLKNYTNSIARLKYQKNMDTTIHEIFVNKSSFENNDIGNNFEKNILEIENELIKIENIIGNKKLDMNENLGITDTLNKLLKIVNEKKFKLFKDKL